MRRGFLATPAFFRQMGKLFGRSVSLISTFKTGKEGVQWRWRARRKGSAAQGGPGLDLVASSPLHKVAIGRCVPSRWCRWCRRRDTYRPLMRGRVVWRTSAEQAPAGLCGGLGASPCHAKVFRDSRPPRPARPGPAVGKLLTRSLRLPLSPDARQVLMAARWRGGRHDWRPTGLPSPLTRGRGRGQGRSVCHVFFFFPRSHSVPPPLQRSPHAGDSTR